MKYLFAPVIVFIIFCAISTQSAFAAKYNVNINVFSNENSFTKKPFSYYIDFKEEINLASVKMTIASKKMRKKSKKVSQVPIYVIPLAKYKALIYFMPHKKMDEDSDLSYILSFESGKWNGKATGSKALKKSIKINPNLAPNHSFEKVTKTVDRFMTWNGRTSVVNWTLQDFSRKFLSLKNIKSTCRPSTKEAFHGTRSLCFSNGKPRTIESRGETRNILISGSARTSEIITLKPNTTYKLSFFVKITEQTDNEMNFLGIGASLSFLNINQRPVPGGLFSALYSINSIMQEEYLNKWIYVEARDVTSQNTHFGIIDITEKISGITYIDMLELREVKDSNYPEIIIDKIIKN
jgi:hypothetical protein